jgi:hypothetical protein
MTTRILLVAATVLASGLFVEHSQATERDGGSGLAHGPYNTIGMPWGVREDMPYLDARAELKAHGILPRKYSVSAKRVKGTPLSVLRTFKEVEYCKLNTRYSCVFSFRRQADGQYFSVYTYGDPTRNRGNDVRVENIRFSKCWTHQICYHPINIRPDYKAPSILGRITVTVH